MDRKRKIIYISYAIIVFLIAMIPVAIGFTNTGTSVGVLGNDFIDISKEWSIESDSEGKSIVDGDYAKYMTEKAGTVNIYYKIPEDFRDSHLIYRSKDVYTKVYIEDELMYETTVYDSPLYNKSPGNIWNVVRINSYEAGKWIRMEITAAYEDNSVVVDHIKLGNKSDILMSYVQSKAWDIIISIMIIIVGLALLILNIYIYLSKSVSKAGNICLAVYAVNIGIWCLCETNVLQMIIDDVRLIQLLDNIVMFTGSLQMLLFIDAKYDIMKNMFVRLFCYADIALLTYCFIVQVTDVSDFHNIIIMAWISFFITMPVLFIAAIRGTYKEYKAGKIQASNILYIVGFLLMTITGALEGIRYAGTDGSDRAQMLRLGLLFFIVCAAIANQMENYKMIAQGAKYDIVKNLAYCDGLTGLYNRTSYLEDIKELEEKEKLELGIVFLDINNLKLVNDNYGHEMGDKYIMSGSEVIAQSFGKYGKSYRTGGDEFCVFIQDKNVDAVFEQANEAFYSLLNKVNDDKKFPIKMQIACGCVKYDKSSGKTINEMIQEADELMYKNKAELKKSKSA